MVGGSRTEVSYLSSALFNFPVETKDLSEAIMLTIAHESLNGY